MIKVTAVAIAAMLISTSVFAEDTATADMISNKGKSVGQITLQQTSDGVLLKVKLAGLPPGGHGFHIHSVGRCKPNFSAAGGHFNPRGKQHGLKNPKGYHAGDMHNLKVSADGTVTTEIRNRQVTFKKARNGLFDRNGSSIIIHARPDSHRRNPGVGGKIACGIIRR